MNIVRTLGRSLASLAAVGALALVGCSGGSSNGGSDGGATGEAGTALDTRNYCGAWASLCPKKATTSKLADCKACETSQDFTKEGCYFSACSVAVGKCDNDEPGDTSILACATERGWKAK